MDGLPDNAGRSRSAIFVDPLSIQAPDSLEISFRGFLKSARNTQEGRQIESTLCDSISPCPHCYVLSSGDQVGFSNLRFKLRYEEPGPGVIDAGSQPQRDRWYQFRAVRQAGTGSNYANNTLLGENLDPVPLARIDAVAIASVGSVIVDDLDFLLHFRKQSTGFQCGDISGTLMGETFGGKLIEEPDTIDVKCK